MTAAKEAGKKRKDKRKARTQEVSSPSSSESEEIAVKPLAQPASSGDQQANTESIAPDASDDVIGAPVGLITVHNPLPDPEQAFEAFYLRQATKAFANDLDKLRSAGDFRENSVGILVAALKQGTACFSREERVRVGGAVGAG